MRTVYRVVEPDADGRLRSACASYWEDRLPELRRFIRVYRSANGRLRTVSACFAFRRRADALAFARECHQADGSRREVWSAGCSSTKAIQVIASGYVEAFVGFANANAKPDGWRVGLNAPPPGTLYCKNLRLVRKVD